MEMIRFFTDYTNGYTKQD